MPLGLVICLAIVIDLHQTVTPANAGVQGTRSNIEDGFRAPCRGARPREWTVQLCRLRYRPIFTAARGLVPRSATRIKNGTNTSLRRTPESRARGEDGFCAPVRGRVFTGMTDSRRTLALIASDRQQTLSTNWSTLTGMTDDAPLALPFHLRSIALPFLNTNDGITACDLHYNGGLSLSMF